MINFSSRKNLQIFLVLNFKGPDSRIKGDMASSNLTVVVLLGIFLVNKCQNLIKNTKEINMEGRLIISEVNPDNPGHDIAEFLELHHTSGQNVSLDGFTLVFYNGKTNTAYKVLNLTGYTTDKKGFFLIGSSSVRPVPNIILPNNTIQNGPDAIALYFGKGPYDTSMRVTRDGLVDALVHKTRSTDQADDLVNVLTPGMEAFLEDVNYQITDESIGRCLDINGQLTFQLTHLSPGSENYCSVTLVALNEISSPYADDLYVEIHGPSSTFLYGLTLAFISGMDQSVYYATDIKGQTDTNGLFLLVSEKHDNRAQQTLPDSARLFKKGGGAVALYKGKSSEVLQNKRYTTSGLINALVYGDYEDMAAHPLQDMTIGNNIIYWHTWDVNISASLCSEDEDPLFILGGSTPGQPNNCPQGLAQHSLRLCFEITTDCSEWEGDQVPSKVLNAVVRSWQSQCKCHVSSSLFTDANLTCQSHQLTLHVRPNATLSPQNAELDVALPFVLIGRVINVQNKNATFTVCPQADEKPTPTLGPPTSTPPVLLISEVNPNNPGSAEDTEFVELYHTSNSSVSLAGYWLVLINGKNNLVYSVLNLKGHYTDKNGYFLVGSAKVTPKPHIVLRSNTIQNGADAVALYYRPGKEYIVNKPVTNDGLVDAVVYVSQARDDASGLLNVLTPKQQAICEDERFLVEDESLSRCHGFTLLDHSSFKITRITPLTKNDCETELTSRAPFVTSSLSTVSTYPGTPFTPMIFISEVGVLQGSIAYNFIELKGPPGAQVQDYTLVIYSSDGKVYHRIGLQGNIRDNGLYLIGTNDTSDQQLPLIYRPYILSPEAIALYRGRPESFPAGSFLTKTDILDAFILSWKNSSRTEVLRDLTQHIVTFYETQQLVSVSLCTQPGGSSTSILPVQQPSPGSENICPSSATAIQLDLCVKDSSMDCSEWQSVEQSVLDRMKISLSQSMQHHCSCTAPPSYIQDVNVICSQEKLSISGNVLTTLSDQHLIRRWNADIISHGDQFTLQGSSMGSFMVCLMPERIQGSFKAWQVSLLVLLLLLLICGVIGLIFYLRKRSPQNYTTIEMNPHTELTFEY
ncbi:uncharacterized protein LOC130284591 isoform X2 [Hyla sarda]|uniref:uncharacterized protein LOC130284591 isoform X2 n=1 Tax=Hyla sarda TaxID=327740 RepID=UPI0024C45002|nr:uncharacterized protein LOC130284591 isoform X2 [Hyla sarda]